MPQKRVVRQGRVRHFIPYPNSALNPPIPGQRLDMTEEKENKDEETKSDA